MKNIGQIGSRTIHYLPVKYTVDWAEQLPDQHWLVVPICDQVETDLLDNVAQACLEKNVLYVCAIGMQCELVHDWFDECVVANRIRNQLPVKSPDDFETAPMTTWHHNFDEGIWFAATCAFPSVYDQYIEVHKIICLDLRDKPDMHYLMELIWRIKRGWLPT